ncbi:MAG: hypothetical protein KatS3mg076_2427 [Candidatus Binatia bacterium]|nr:MAG: hypothetical protein KatS3mg076_2427 [Candidatus Binatia bacterium]
MPIGFGDIDGDGYGDFVLCPMLADGGPRNERRNSGEVHIVYGNGEVRGVVVDDGTAPVTTLFGATAGDLLGTHVFVADFDRDGFDDVLVGAQNADAPGGNRRNSGAAYLYFGRKERPPVVDLAEEFPRVVRIFGRAASDRLGVWVSGGDLDGDGHLDLLLGADQADGPHDTRPAAGAVYVLYGGAEWPPVVDLADPTGLPLAVFHGVDPHDHFGSTILAADFDDDGKDELVVSSAIARASAQVKGVFLAGGDGPANDRADAGEVAVLFFGSSEPRPLGEIDLASADPQNRTIVYGANARHATGEELAAGDFDGDGKLDLAIGALQATGPAGGRGAATGRAYVVFHLASRRGEVVDLAAPTEGVTVVYGRRGGTISGDTLLAIDLDGDGFDDLLDAAPAEGTRDLEGTFRATSGVLDVLFGRPRWPPAIDLVLVPDDQRHVQIRGADAGDQFAYSLAAGDVDRDGRPDILANAMTGDGFENRARDAGELYVFSNSIFFDPSPGTLAPLFLNVDIQPVFSAACLPCHAPPEPAAGLRLDEVLASADGLLGRDRAGRPSSQVPDLLVAPGAPEASYLLEKIAEAPPRVGDRMPPPPSPPLPSRAREALRRWVAGGAPVANEPVVSPPPPEPPPRGLAALVLATVRLRVVDTSGAETEFSAQQVELPLRLVGPKLRVFEDEWKPWVLVSGERSLELSLSADGEGSLDRRSGEASFALELSGFSDAPLRVAWTTGTASAGPLAATGSPLDFDTGALGLAGAATSSDGDSLLFELEGFVVGEVPRTPGLVTEIQAIFSRSCALANCHIGDGAAELSLEPFVAFRELVHRPSTQVDAILVLPGSPDESYLLEKIREPEPRVGERMPIGGELDELEIEAIRLWIAGGAPR